MAAFARVASRLAIVVPAAEPPVRIAYEFMVESQQLIRLLSSAHLDADALRRQAMHMSADLGPHYLVAAQAYLQGLEELK